MKIGDVVQVTFLDHTMTKGDYDHEPLEFEVAGRLVKKDRKSYLIATWYPTNGVIDHNTELFCIVRSTIVKERRLR